MLAKFDSTPTPIRLGLVIAAAVALNALYCIAYAAAQGRGETLGAALAWGLVNIAPWVAAIELGRRSGSPARVAALLAGAMIATLAGQAATGGSDASAFWLVRALPGLLVALSAIIALRALCARRAQTAAGPFDLALACDSDWIAAAGNYVELHRSGSVALVRSTLGGAADALGGAFVRVHRSYLVRRDAIRRVDRGSVLLECGKRLPVGPAFRAVLEAA